MQNTSDRPSGGEYSNEAERLLREELKRKNERLCKKELEHKTDRLQRDKESACLRRSLSLARDTFLDLLDVDETLLMIRKRIDAYLANQGILTQERDDLIQDTFERFYRLGKKDNPQAIRDPIAYIMTIAANVRKNFFTAKQRERSRVRWTIQDQDGLSPIDRLLDPDALPDEQFNKHEENGKLYRAISRLPQPCQRIMWLCAQGCSCKEIAQTLNMPLSSIYYQINKGMALLKADLSDQEE